MLVINKKTGQSHVEPKPIELQKPTKLPPVPRLRQNVLQKHRFADWYSMYDQEVESIIDDYIDVIMNDFSSESHTHSLNIEQFRAMMTKMIYDRSENSLRKHVY